MKVVAPHNTPSNNTLPRLKPLHMLLLAAIGAYGASAHAASPASPASPASSVGFEDGFLMQGVGSHVDVSRFEKGNVAMPGTYSVDVFVNQDRVGRMDVPFTAAGEGVEAQPCLDVSLLTRMGVNVSKLAPEVSAKLAAGQGCLPINEAVEGASSAFDFSEQQLDFSIPQISMTRSARGYVSPELWDSGVNAAMLGYSFNLYRANHSGQGSHTQGYLGLNAGVNLGNWHFRHDGSYTFDSKGQRDYQDIATYVQRDVPSLSSQLTMGQAYTSGELFDATPYTGVRLATDDRMLPDSMRGYAPTVRGVASSNARVTIRQNNVIIYETTVAPGAFEINDLYATGYGGDLDVSVQEADGSVHTFSMPYAAVPQSLRPGVNRFSAVAGAVRNQGELSKEPLFVQGTWQRGINNLLTGYTGATAAEGYASVLAGGALNTRWGALGVDVTQSSLNLNGKRYAGTSARVSYAKNLADSGTNIAVAGYRYSTGGYFGLNDAMSARYAKGRTESPENVLRQRSRASVMLSQQLGGRWGQLNLSGSSVDYWNRSGRDVEYSVAYANSYKNISYSLSANRQRDANGKVDTLYYAGVSIPLGSTRPASFSGNVSRDTSGSTRAQGTLSGATGEDNNLSYGITASYNNGKGSSSNGGGANVTYRSPLAEFAASVGGGPGYVQGSVGVRGAVVAHPGGITLSQPISETIGIIEAPDAEGARVLNASGVRVDSRGYAVVPYLTPYSMNNVEIDPKGLSTDVELQVTSQQVAPRAGSVAMIKYATVTGRSAVLEATRANGEALPFGASVLNAQGQEVGVVGQASRIFARGLDDQGQLTVLWGNDGASSCRIDYTLPVRQKGKSDGYQQISTSCQAPVTSAVETPRSGIAKGATPVANDGQGVSGETRRTP